MAPTNRIPNHEKCLYFITETFKTLFKIDLIESLFHLNHNPLIVDHKPIFVTVKLLTRNTMKGDLTTYFIPSLQMI